MRLVNFGIHKSIRIIEPEEKAIGEMFLDEFYSFISRKICCPSNAKEFVKGYSKSYQVHLLSKYVDYLLLMYGNTARHQKEMLKEFKDAPGAYFDIDQTKINVILQAPPKKFGKAKAAAEASQKVSDKVAKEELEEHKELIFEKPAILLNSKALTMLQMERFPKNLFLDKYEASAEEVNPDLKCLKELYELILNKVILDKDFTWG